MLFDDAVIGWLILLTFLLRQDEQDKLCKVAKGTNFKWQKTRNPQTLPVVRD